jgi:chorismate mutase
MGKIKNKLVVAGPCAVEKKSQLYNTVKHICNYTDIIRAGIWKGRTSPKSYPGVGEKALPWIQDIQNQYQIPAAIEVGNTRHVELALKYDIKIMWLGARTTVNPFAVQDLKLWIGAINGFHRVGVKNIKTIHRGFYSDNNINYRNHPRWDLLKEFKTKYSEIPVLSDPSHLTGDTKHIEKLSLESLKEGTDGFMFEVHNNPHEALSDQKQQLNPKDFKALIDKLSIKCN